MFGVGKAFVEHWEKATMTKYGILVGVACMLACVWAGSVSANSQVSDPSTMAVAPSTLLLSKVQSNVTIHTAIPYNLVDVGSLSMEGLCPISAGADLCGDLVLKFDEGAVKALDIVAPPSATLTLIGTLLDGEPFLLTDTVQVKR
jgi:hypothetical protein